MDAKTVLDKLRDLAKDAAKEGRPDHGERAAEARKIIESFLKPPPPSEAISVLLESLTQRRDEQPPGSMAWDIYEAAIRRLPPTVHAPWWQNLYRPKIKPKRAERSPRLT